MTAFVCFLRGVNVGGNGTVPMADLRNLLEKQGLENVKTVLQSGNVVFAARGSKAALAKKIETAIEKAFQYRSEVQLLTPTELRRIVDGNPYPAEARRDPSHLLAHFLPKPPARDAAERMQAVAAAGEMFTVTPACAYVFYANGLARSKLALGIDRALGVRGTGRNWNTVNKLLALAEAL